MDSKEFTRELARLTKDANNDIRKCDDLRAFLDEHAHLLEDTYFSIVYLIERELINKVSGTKMEDLRFGQAEILHGEYRHILNELIGDDTSMMIRLLARRAALCWLRVQEAERCHSYIHQGTTVQPSASVWADKRLTMAQNRFLRACDSLSRMRLLKQVEREADLWDARAGNARLQKSQSALKLLKAASQGG